LRYGGLQTIASYGVGLGSKKDFSRVRDQLASAMGTDMIEWLRTLPKDWVSGNVAVVHAGADPLVPIAHQRSSHLLWGHPEFEIVPRNDGVWVLHGHTIVSDPYAVNGRIAVDTGAYATGRLTVAHVLADHVSFSCF
jgi:serine/threonine protein phosphatase 1